MPKRVVDGEGVWRSSKLARVEPIRARAEYANIIPLALANGSFEGSPRLVWSQVYSFNRPDVTPEDVEIFLKAFEDTGLLFRWTGCDGKQWAYFVGIDKPGRLPGKSRKGKNEKVGAEPPPQELRKFLESKNFPGSGFGSGSSSGIGSGLGGKPVPASRPPDTRHQACYEFAYKSFRGKHGTPPSWNGKDQKNLKTLLKSNPAITVGEFSRRWDFYLASTESFTAKQGDSLAFFCSKFDSFIDGPLTDAARKEQLGGKPSSSELALHNARGLGFNGKPN